MNTVARIRLVIFLAFLFILLAVVPAPAQELLPPLLMQAVEQQQAQPGQPPQSDVERAAAERQKKGHKITPKEAEEIFQSVDDILKFVSEDSKLPIHHPVKRSLATRDQVRAYIAQQLKEDKDAQKLQRSEIVLKKLGLLPREFQLQPFLVQLLGEQIAGYYDTKTKTFYLLDWVEPETVKMVIAHELTHALQDQAVDLEKWLNEPEKRAKVDPDDDSDDEASAREAITEGQAMVTMLDYLIQPRSIVQVPQLAQTVGQMDLNDDNYPLLKNSPMLLQESLAFPYRYGLTFIVHQVLRSGRQKAFAGTLQNPPHSTRDVMEPESYDRGEQVPILRLPKLKDALGNDYQKYDTGGIGEFDVYVMVKQFRGQEEAERISHGWRGGVYLAAQTAASAQPSAAQEPANTSPGTVNVEIVPKPANAVPAPKNTGDLAIVYESHWDTPADAMRFADDYATFLPRKYKSLRAGGETRRGMALRRWLTDEGPVSIEVNGDRVLVMESFSDPVAARIRDLVWAVQPSTTVH